MPRRTIDRYLSICGAGSRTAAAKLVRDGRVRVNGRLAADPASWIDPAKDTIAVDGKAVLTPQETRVVLFNKPRGVLVTLRDPAGRPCLRDALPAPFRDDKSLRPIGRLDRASAGLLLLSNDNRLGARLLGASSLVPKRYRVKLSPPPSRRWIERFQSGVDIGDDAPTLPADVAVERAGPKSAVLHITIIEGRNRQIRRMAKAAGCEVEWLVRIAVGPLQLGKLAPGSAREATSRELKRLLQV